jgi:cytochrome c biogenesis protein CcmG, thiol:disulfide interchange protein DsbE
MPTRRIVLIIVAIAVAVAVYEGAQHHSHSRGAPPGAVDSPAAEFSLQDLDGKPLALANYRGKVVLLNFWATWCTPCRGEIPQFVEYQNKYGPQGLQLLGISMDDDATPVHAFYQQFKMNYPVAIGSANLAESYGGVLGLPVTFLIGRDGRIAAKYVGAVETPVLQQKIELLLQAK